MNINNCRGGMSESTWTIITTAAVSMAFALSAEDHYREAINTFRGIRR